MNNALRPVASVDDLGHVKMNGNGEAAITLYYSSRVLYARVTVPYPNKVDAAVYDKFPRNNFIDVLVIDGWAMANGFASSVTVASPVSTPARRIAPEEIFHPNTLKLVEESASATEGSL